MNLEYLGSTGLALALVACSSSPEPAPRGLQLAVAPLDLIGIDVACYDILVSGDAGDVWSQGDPDTTADDGDVAAICSDVYGNGAGGDVSYVGPCDASPEADTDDELAGVQNSVTIWFDGLYTGSSATTLTPLPGVTQAITGLCNGSLDGSCSFPDLPDFVEMVPFVTCTQDSECTFDAEAPSWQDPCGATGCTLQFACNENEDTLVEFNFTVMRNAKQGFFDIAVNFEDVFCSAKYDTCYDVGSADERPIDLLHGTDGERDHTGIMGLACTGNPNSSDVTTLHRSEIWVWCDQWDHFFVLDPAAGPGNVEVDEARGLDADLEVQIAEAACLSQLDEEFQTWSKGADPNDPAFTAWCDSLGDCTDWQSLYFTQAECLVDLGYCGELAAYTACMDAASPAAATLRYATYWGTEQLDCGDGVGSCGKVYWNVAVNLEHLQDQGFTGCEMVTIATASSSDSTALTHGELLESGSYYPIIDFGNMDGDWNTGLPLVGQSDIPCVSDKLNAPGSLVHTEYAATGQLSDDDVLNSNGPIINDFYTWLCFEFSAGDASPSLDEECRQRLCAPYEGMDFGPSFCSGGGGTGGGTPAAFTLTSSAFAEGATIPSAPYTCDGGSYPEGTSPPLQWANPPAGTQAFALVMDDLSATGMMGTGTWVHWVVYDIPVATTSLPQGVGMPAGASMGHEEMGMPMYAGPCPPPGSGTHQYRFRLLALDLPIDMGGALLSMSEIETMFADHIIGTATLTGVVAN